jgi:uncharacterized protein (TIGR02996 family)
LEVRVTHDDAFLQSILEAPDDDSPRLIYADWLDERGDPRAEFLRLECRLARLRLADRKGPLGDRFGELAQTLDREWVLCVSRVFNLLGLGAAKEAFARALHRRLSGRLAADLSGAAAVISGAGVHWNCRAKYKRRACEVHCFAGPESAPCPEYSVRFEGQRGTPLWGRTADEVEVIRAVCAWLGGRTVQALYAECAFVEQIQRALERIEQQTAAARPRLAQNTTRELVRSEWGDESCILWFRAGDRSAAVNYWTSEGVADVKGHWDECLQFEVQSGDAAFLAALLERWLCDNAMPSAIRRDFPPVVLSDVAPYYEQGRGIEGEFILSWSGVERFYRDVADPFAAQALALIGQMRAAGYDRTLRAGTSLYTLILSRSRRHGLRPGQPRLAFTFGGARFIHRPVAPGAIEVAAFLDGHERAVVFPSAELSADLDALLQQLQAMPID